MFFSRISRQGAHHVNSRSLSGSKRRGEVHEAAVEDAREHGLLFRRLAGLRGLAQLGMDVAGLQRDVEVAAEQELPAGGVDLGHERVERLQEAHLGRIVAVAVRHVHGRDDPVAELRR